MDRFNEKSRKGFTRRSVLKAPMFCWLTSLLKCNAFAKVLSAEPMSIGGTLEPRTTCLNGAWSLTYGPLSEYPEKSPGTKPPSDWPTIPATVPGNVELDMVVAGKIEPLETGNRVLQALKLENYQWWYKRTFKAGHGEPDERAELVFEGLDCVATVWLNGKEVGKAANMLVEQRFDVTPVLRPGEINEIVVRIDPAVLVGLSYPHTGWEQQGNSHWESLYVRKAAHMYGWDIMPRIVSAGLWKDVFVEWIRPARISSAYWHTKSVDVKKGKATIAVAWQTEGVTESAKHKLQVVLRRDGEIAARWETGVTAPSGEYEFDLDQVEFWWPRGYGERPLYEAAVSLVNPDGKVVDRSINRVGIRTIVLDRTDILIDGKGKFGFTINGVPVFVKGTDYSCLDGLHSRDHLHLDRTVELMAEANCNMARCWGGNVYPEDRFFDLCDEAGIMVWQDFNMACAIYPKTDEFLDAIDKEARKIVPRFRNHPSLAIWSGNNECDDAFEWAMRDGRPSIDPNLDVSTRKTIPNVLKELDPNRAYLPSSPYHSPAVVAAGNETDLMPEVHLWGPRGYFKAPFYIASPAHFASEIGYHGCPSRSSLERMMDPDAVSPWVTGHEWNEEWLTKSCRSSPDDKSTLGRNDLMVNQIKAFFGACPENLDDFILASQITQAEAMKFFIELFRQNKGFDAEKGQKQGILWWNIRDGWPILSDAVVDYYFNKKLAFHYIQRVQRDVQAICCEEAGGQHAVVVVNDTLKPVRGHLEINRAGDTAKLFDTSFDVEPNGKATLGSLPHPAKNEMWQLKWTTEGVGLHTSHYLAFTPTLDFEEYKEWLRTPGLLPV
jgi:beta-mannosidase